MSTKIVSLARFMVDVGKMEAMQVLHDELCNTLLLMLLSGLLLDVNI